MVSHGNHLVAKGSKVELTADGLFRLNEAATGKRIRVADSSGTGVAHAAMLDTGNFVLANLESISLWESFDQPTDTIFPTESLNQETILFARYKETTHSRGRFQLTLQRDGNFVL